MKDWDQIGHFNFLELRKSESDLLYPCRSLEPLTLENVIIVVKLWFLLDVCTVG